MRAPTPRRDAELHAPRTPRTSCSSRRSSVSWPAHRTRRGRPVVGGRERGGGASADRHHGVRQPVRAGAVPGDATTYVIAWAQWDPVQRAAARALVGAAPIEGGCRYRSRRFHEIGDGVRIDAGQDGAVNQRRAMDAVPSPVRHCGLAAVTVSCARSRACRPASAAARRSARSRGSSGTLDRMTLEQRVGQMLMVRLPGGFENVRGPVHARGAAVRSELNVGGFAVGLGSPHDVASS
jgi:hypothetical protein